MHSPDNESKTRLGLCSIVPSNRLSVAHIDIHTGLHLLQNLEIDLYQLKISLISDRHTHR